MDMLARNVMIDMSWINLTPFTYLGR